MGSDSGRQQALHMWIGLMFTSNCTLLAFRSSTECRQSPLIEAIHSQMNGPIGHREYPFVLQTSFAHSFPPAAGKPSTPDPQFGPMKLFTESLTAEYERLSAACEEKLYPTPTAEYTNLAVIKKELMSRTIADMFTRSTLHGGLDEIMREKMPVNLEDVFKVDDRQQAVNYVLVEGAPGVGKSTFALELCRRWHSIELMKRFTAVVLLRLRERRVQEAKSEADLLYHEDDEIKNNVVKLVCSSSGKNLLLVLDGFDELPSRLQRTSFIAKVIRGRCLRKATILVTSRPSARDSLLSLRPHPDKHIEVLGFTSVLVDQYANSVYGEESQLLADFHTYVNTNPAIKSMMYIPLNSAIVVEIYREYRKEGRPIPQTMTQVYTELTLIRIRSYLRDQCKQPLDSLPVKLEDLSMEFRDQLFCLAELALNGSINKVVIFERLPVGCTCLGLMTASQEMYIGKKGAVNYNFFHLTHQEFLAALYISRLTLAEKRESFLQCLDEDDPPEMSVVWKFVVGLVGLEDIGWDEYMPWLGWLLCNTLPKEKKGEQEEDLRVTPFLAQCLYEAQERVDWGSPLETSCVTFGNSYTYTQLSPLDCFAVGYCVAASKWVWDLNFLYCKLEPEMVKSVVCGLKSKQEINGSIRKLDLSGNPIGAEGVAHLLELPHEILQGISYLGVSECDLDSAALDLLSRLVPNMTNMRRLDIRVNPAGHGGTVKVLKALSTVNQLQTLDITNINLGPTDITALSQLIRPSVGSVKELRIGDQELSQDHTEIMLKAVLCPSSLESLCLIHVHLTTDVATLLQDNHNLVKLAITDCTPGTLSHIAEGLHSQTTLRKLDVVLFIEQLTTNDVMALSEMLRKNRSLKTMTLTLESDFIRQDVQTLISALLDNHTLEQLHLKCHHRKEFTELELNLLDPRISVTSLD